MNKINFDIFTYCQLFSHKITKHIVYYIYLYPKFFILVSL